MNSSINSFLESLVHALRGSRKLLSEGVSLDGEYWITPDGDVIDASPGRHSEIATNEMFSKHHGGDQVLRWLNTVPDSYFYMGPAARAHAEIPVPSKEVRAAFAKEIEGVSNGGHPTDFMILERGWIRNYEDAFDVDNLTDKNIKTISELLWSIYHVNPDDAGDEIILVRAHATKKDYKIRIVDIMNEPESVLQRSAFTRGDYYGKQGDSLSESLRGEFWIDDSGQDTFADGDYGDVNHEGYAFFSALGIDSDSKEVRDLDIYPGHITSKAARWLRAEGASKDAVAFFVKGGDARDWAMEKMGWIRVDDSLFQVHGLDDKKLERIFDFVWEDKEYEPDGAITIEDLKTKKSYEISYAEMDSINTTGDLFRKQDPDIRAPGQPAGKGVLPAGATDEPHFSLDESLQRLASLIAS